MSLRLLKKEASADSKGDSQRGKGRQNQKDRNAWGRAPSSPKAGKAAAPSAWNRGPPGNAASASSGPQQSAWKSGPPQQSAWNSGPRGGNASASGAPPGAPSGSSGPEKRAWKPPQQAAWGGGEPAWDAQGAASADDPWNAPVATVDPSAWVTAPVAQGDMSAAAWGMEPAASQGGGGQNVGWDTTRQADHNGASVARIRDRLALELGSCAVTAKQLRDKIGVVEPLMQQLAGYDEDLRAAEGKVDEMRQTLASLVATATRTAECALETRDFTDVNVEDLEGELRESVTKARAKWQEENKERFEALQALEEASDLRTLEEAVEWCEELGLDIDATGKLQEFKRRDAAQKKLQEVSSTAKASKEDIASLESALAEAKACDIRAADAQCLLENLKVELQQKTLLLDKLANAVTPAQMKDAIHACKCQGMAAEPLVIQATERLQQEEAQGKRREMAILELRLASEGTDVERLEKAIATASELKLDVSGAKESLQEVKVIAEKRSEAQKVIDEAKQTKDEALLRQALAIYSSKENEQLLVQWTKERKDRERAEADERCKVALEEAIKKKVVSEPLIDAVRAIPGTEGLVALAEGMLDECAERAELLEAEETVALIEAEIAKLKAHEATLVGQKNKDERRNVNKKIFALKDDDNYLSAVRFLKNPEKEGEARRKKLAANRAAEKANVEAYRQAKLEKNATKVEALLSKLPVRERDDAECFLAELQQKAKDAERDANLVELVFQCDTRTFCQLVIEINGIMSDIGCAEGQEFKLRSAAAQKTVIIVFQTVELLRKVDVENRFSGLSRAPTIHFAPDFSEGMDLQLTQARLDGQFLLEKEVRNVAIPSVSVVKKQASDAQAASAAAARKQESVSRGKGAGDFGGKGDKGKNNYKGGDKGGKTHFGEQEILVAVPFAETELKDLAGFRSDLQHFQMSKKVKCNWRAQEQLLEVKGVSVNAAKDELQQLLNFYRDTLKRESRKCYLWFDRRGGAGIDLSPYVGRGMYVDAVDEEPGQEFKVGEIIRQVGETDLSLFTSERAIEDAFGGEFAEHVEMIVEA